ncbi:MAG: MarR family transcriptional regulator [Propionicimonas sp.]|nr:MarR family transcriptional regulator [Propionicimonas sp.]
MDRLANEAWEAMLTAHARLMRGFEAEDVWGDLGMRGYDVLYTLSKRPGPVRMGELGGSVLLSQPGLSRLVDRLVQRGLVRRSTDQTDGRLVLVCLTEAGAARQKAIGRQHARSVTHAMAGLDADELRQLRSIATKLTSSRDPGASPG